MFQGDRMLECIDCVSAKRLRLQLVCLCSEKTKLKKNSSNFCIPKLFKSNALVRKLKCTSDTRCFLDLFKLNYRFTS